MKCRRCSKNATTYFLCTELNNRKIFERPGKNRVCKLGAEAEAAAMLADTETWLRGAWNEVSRLKRPETHQHSNTSPCPAFTQTLDAFLND